MVVPQMIYINGLGGTFYVSRNINYGEYREQVDKALGMDVSDSNCQALMTVYETPKRFIYWIWTDSKSITSLVHECIHAILHFFRNRGIDNITTDNEEFLAYYVDYLIDEILKYKEPVKKTKKKGK